MTPTASEPARNDGHADEPFVAHEVCEARQQGRRAEIDEIDDQQFGQAAEERRIGFARRAGEPMARQPRPGDERADCRADQEPAGRDEQRHRRALKHGEAPAARAEAEYAEDAHVPPPRCETRRPFFDEDGAPSRPHGVVSILNHCMLYFLTEPSAKAASSALLNFAVRSASRLANPHPFARRRTRRR